MTNDTDRLAALIRELDGNHDLGAGALAEQLITRGVQVGPREPSNRALDEADDVFQHTSGSESEAIEAAVRAAYQIDFGAVDGAPRE